MSTTTNLKANLAGVMENSVIRVPEEIKQTVSVLCVRARSVIKILLCTKRPGETQVDIASTTNPESVSAGTAQGMTRIPLGMGIRAQIPTCTVMVEEPHYGYTLAAAGRRLPFLTGLWYVCRSRATSQPHVMRLSRRNIPEVVGSYNLTRDRETEQIACMKAPRIEQIKS